MTLYVVATPIGNLSDISERAKATLTNTTLIIAEDTRTIGQLLKLLSIEKGEGVYKKEFISSHAQSSVKELERALERCSDHMHIALVTDAGTPGISDPGCMFIDAFRKKYKQALISPIPGPSACVAALSVCGFPADHFEFLGFIPHKKGRQTLLNTIQETAHTVVFYDSPHRILKTLEELSAKLGGREIFVGREITKLYEEFRWGSAEDVLLHYKAHLDTCRGEFVCIVAPKRYRNR